MNHAFVLTVLLCGCSGETALLINGASGGSDARGGAPATGGASGTGGVTATGGAAPGPPFSFFLTSMAAIQELSGSRNGFGGDLRHGKADGLSGADEICRQIAEKSLAGAGARTWRAFLSVTRGPDGNPVHAIDRIGDGPWYDRLGRMMTATKQDLAQTRPQGADTAIINDLPNELGVPNHAPDGSPVDNHDTLTGSGAEGRLYSTDWSHTATTGRARSAATVDRGSGTAGRAGAGEDAPRAAWASTDGSPRSTRPAAAPASISSRPARRIRATRRSARAAAMVASTASE
jgi:hypothetical protein